jgi:acetylornithine deacetylase
MDQHTRRAEALLGADAVRETLAGLVRIPSVNPHLATAYDDALVDGARGGNGEARIAAHIVAWLEAHGVRSWLEEAAPGRPNVVAEVGDGECPTLVLCAHTDTVSAAGMEIEPYEPRVEGDRLYGRGSYDMKAGVAAIMCALASLAGSGVRGRVLGAFVVDEEFASIGAQDFVRRHRADACILTEPSALDLVLAHKGFVWLEVVTRGVAAHGSRWDLGSSAIAAMAPVVSALDGLDRQVLRGRNHPLTGPASLHCGTISGGEGISTYAAECRLQVERRTIPGEGADAVIAELTSIIHAVCAEAEVRTLLVREPLTCPADAPIARCVRDSATAVLGRTPADTGVAYWMDAAVFAGAGIPTVNIGGDGRGAHGAVESADLGSTAALARVLVAAAERFLGE